MFEIICLENSKGKIAEKVRPLDILLGFRKN